MSWFARSIANSLKLDEGDGHDQDDKSPNSTDSSSPRGVKEDLSELKKTLSRQFWGVASFLAPPPSDDGRLQPSDLEEEDQEKEVKDEDEDLIAGIRNDFAEIGGRFKSGFSKLSRNVNVSEITKIASNFLQIGSESAVGVTEEVVAFARDIATHPETWLDFPVPDDHDFDDFDMSDAQQEHALAVERLSPRLAALRMELCPGYMSECCFWKIYFVLLHPRLSKEDAELLSTPQVLQARAMLSHELPSKAKPNQPVLSEIDSSISKETTGLPHEESLSVPSHLDSESPPPKASHAEVSPSMVVLKTTNGETVQDKLEKDKHLVQSTEMQVVDKAVIEEEPVHQTKHRYLSNSISQIPDEKIEDDVDDWLKEESSEMEGTSGTTIHIENDEDVSFSDLEEDDGEVPVSYKKVTSSPDDSLKDPRDWVRLSESSIESVKNVDPVAEKHVRSEQVSAQNSNSKESNDWLDVDDIDVM